MLVTESVQTADVDSILSGGLDANMQSSHAAEKADSLSLAASLWTRRSRRNRACHTSTRARRMQSRPLFFFRPMLVTCCTSKLETLVEVRSLERDEVRILLHTPVPPAPLPTEPRSYIWSKCRTPPTKHSFPISPDSLPRVESCLPFLQLKSCESSEVSVIPNIQSTLHPQLSTDHS